MTAGSTIVQTAPVQPRPERWLLLFILGCFTAQVLVALSVWTSGRTLLRAAPFVGSLALLVLVNGRPRRHLAKPWALAVLLVTWLFLLNPTNGGALAAVAQAVLTTAIIAPLFWSSRLFLTTKQLAMVVALWWAYHAVSAGLGILQFYWPETFAFRPSDQLTHFSSDYVESLTIERPDGVSVLRPMGLTDLPGGACVSSLYVVVIGCYFLLVLRRAWMLIGVIASIVGAGYTMLLCEVRSVQIVTLGSVLLMLGLLAARRRVDLARRLALLAGACVVAAVMWAAHYAGPSVAARMETLTAEDPGELYYQHRGFFLAQTVEETLPSHPLGVGLGRWGMMNLYFGDESAAPPLHVEVQWTGWALDGGFVLVLLSAICLIAALLAVLKPLLRLQGEALVLQAVFATLNVAIVAMTFNSPVFNSQLGMEFWLFNGLAGTVAWASGEHLAR